MDGPHFLRDHCSTALYPPPPHHGGSPVKIKNIIDIGLFAIFFFWLFGFWLFGFLISKINSVCDFSFWLFFSAFLFSNDGDAKSSSTAKGKNIAFFLFVFLVSGY